MENKNKCKKCNSTLTYLRNKLTERVCRSCGNIDKIKQDNTKQ